MQLFYNSELKEGQTSCTLDREERNHLVKVLRKNIGDIVHFTNGNGLLAKGAIRMISSNSVDIELTESHLKQPPKAQLTMVVAPTKNNDRYEWFLEKATEIGISTIQPVICDQSERRVIKEDRFERVIQSALKQSLEVYKPNLLPLKTLKEFLSENHSGSLYIAHCEDDQPRVFLDDSLVANEDCIILIGPEGDFSKEEIDLALNAGFKAVSLGHKRLRTETAAVYATMLFNSKNS
jgi:16S rRNA (uracil1498-N3)-methyltransferase